MQLSLKVFVDIVFAHLLILFGIVPLYGQVQDTQVKSQLVSMRLIGHKLLTCDGNHTARVLPIEKYGNSYLIRFEDSLEIDPSMLELIVDTVMTEYEISQNYWVDVRQCVTGTILHSYQVGPDLGDMLPCRGRILPRACYQVSVSLHLPAVQSADVESDDIALLPWLCLILPVVLGFFIWQSRGKDTPTDIPQQALSKIGNTILDERHLTLTHLNQTVELSHKEAELLKMLYQHVHSPVERSDLLAEVWGDQGDYVGRTLDVFISRLRKKLQTDASLKIVNIRGVGYKLVVDR